MGHGRHRAPHRRGQGVPGGGVDAFSRRVVGWSIADHIRAELVVDAVQMAIWRRRPPRARPSPTPTTGRGTRPGLRAPASSSRPARLDGLDRGLLRQGLRLHCTSWCWLGGNPSAELASLAFDESGFARDGWVEELGVAVVGFVTGEQAGSVPSLDGGWMHAEGLGDLGDGELAGCASRCRRLGRAWLRRSSRTIRAVKGWPVPEL